MTEQEWQAKYDTLWTQYQGVMSEGSSYRKLQTELDAKHQEVKDQATAHEAHVKAVTDSHATTLAEMEQGFAKQQAIHREQLAALQADCDKRIADAAEI